MNKTVSGEENLYFEMESVKKETEARIYDEVTGENATTATEQASFEKCTQGAETKLNASAEHKSDCSCDTVALRQMLIVMSVVAAVALLTAIAALILAFTEMKSRNHTTAEMQGIGSSSAMTSEDDDRIEKVSENITTLERKMEERIQQMEKREELLLKEIDELRTLLKNQTAKQAQWITWKTFQEKKIENLTEHLVSTERELKKVKAALVEQIVVLGNATNSTTDQMSELRNIWKAVNATIEETANLTNKVDKELRDIRRSVNNSKESLITNMASQVKYLQTKVDNEMETVWFNLNKTRKCCTNLTSSFDSFRKNVANRSQRLEARIKIEEQKSNSTRQINELHLKRIQSLQNLLNSTRQDIKKMSRDHLTALSLAGNFTRRELQGVWTVVNSTKTSLLGQIKKVTDNLTEQLNQTQVLLQSSDASLFASLININTSITEKVNNVSKMTGPIGPRGFNGSQGPAGPRGAIGSPGPKGAGDFSSCQYKVVEGGYVGGRPSRGLATITEPNGQRIVGATCSTTFAAEYNLYAQQQASGKWKYVCTCRGDSTLFTRPRTSDKKCSLHYWECPLTT